MMQADVLWTTALEIAFEHVIKKYYIGRSFADVERLAFGFSQYK